MRIRPYKSCDAGAIVSWCADEDTFYKWSGGRFGDFPITPEVLDWKYRQENGDCAEPDNFYPMTALEDGVVGSFIIRYTEGDPRRLRFGWVIVDGAQRGRGLGRRMLALGLRYAFEILDARIVTIGVFEDNLPALRCYLAAGFREVPDRPGETVLTGGRQRRILELAMEREQYCR